VLSPRGHPRLKDKRRRRRLDNDDDLVRLEIAAALKQKVPVIPVLGQDVAMPEQDHLPDNIRALARRNGIALSASRWRTDVDRLIKELDRVMKPSSKSSGVQSSPPPPDHSLHFHRPHFQSEAESPPSVPP
jgi:hypothetical protein